MAAITASSCSRGSPSMRVNSMPMPGSPSARDAGRAQRTTPSSRIGRTSPGNDSTSCTAVPGSSSRSVRMKVPPADRFSV